MDRELRGGTQRVLTAALLMALTSPSRPTENWSNTCKTYTRPHIEYCIQSRSPHLRKDIQCLENVQKAATRLVPELRKLTYDQRLQKLGLTTLETRRRRGDLIETLKIMTGKNKLCSEQFFRRSSTGHCTRGHSLKLEKQLSRLDLRRYFLQPTGGQRMEQSTPACHRCNISQHVQGKTGQALVRY